jgi:hypothetical protein
MQDDDEDVRRQFVGKLMKDLVKARLPLRYLAVPMLCASQERYVRTA